MLCLKIAGGVADSVNSDDVAFSGISSGSTQFAHACLIKYVHMLRDMLRKTDKIITNSLMIY